MVHSKIKTVQEYPQINIRARNSVRIRIYTNVTENSQLAVWYLKFHWFWQLYLQQSVLSVSDRNCKNTNLHAKSIQDFQSVERKTNTK